MDDTDACSAMCINAKCGDGFIQMGVETCDDKLETKTCDSDCTAPMCGDKLLNKAAGETCDDGGDSMACDKDCTPAMCGDKVVNMAAGETCDDGNMLNTDACVASCKVAKCGDSFVQAGVEECDDGNMVDNDACSNTCKSQACPQAVFVSTWNGWKYYKVPVVGQMTDNNVRAACEACGLKAPCQALDGCTYNDNICTQTSNEVSCGNPMLGLAQFTCNGQSPPGCPALNGVFQYMGNKWLGACGAQNGQWCVQGNTANNQSGLCVALKP
jgi:cysteine-rich repeat protein